MKKLLINKVLLVLLMSFVLSLSNKKPASVYGKENLSYDASIQTNDEAISHSYKYGVYLLFDMNEYKKYNTDASSLNDSDCIELIFNDLESRFVAPLKSTLYIPPYILLNYDELSDMKTDLKVAFELSTLPYLKQVDFGLTTEITIME